MPLRGGDGSGKSNSSAGGWLRYGVPGVALGLVLAWWLGGRGPSARAQGPGVGVGAVPMTTPADRARAAGATQAEANGTVVITSPVGPPGGSAQMLYLIDTRARAFAVYRVDPANPKGTVKLEAARQYQWDLKLSDYNNLEPRPDAVESTVKSLGPTTSR